MMLFSFNNFSLFQCSNRPLLVVRIKASQRLFTKEIYTVSPNLSKLDYRKQHSIADTLVALKMGRQTHYGLEGNIQDIEDFF